MVLEDLIKATVRCGNARSRSKVTLRTSEGWAVGPCNPRRALRDAMPLNMTLLCLYDVTRVDVARCDKRMCILVFRVLLRCVGVCVDISEKRAARSRIMPYIPSSPGAVQGATVILVLILLILCRPC